MKAGVTLLLLALVGMAGASEPWTLERALDRARVHNPDARIAQHRIAAAQARLEESRSAFWPRLQAQSGYTRTDNPMQVFGSILNQRAYRPSLDFNRVPDLDNLNARGVVSVPLYAGGRNASARQAAKAGISAARDDNAAILNILEFEVSRAFLTVLKARRFIEAAEAAAAAFEANLSVAQRRFEGGTLLRTEVLDLDVRLAQAREDVVRTRNVRSLAEHALRNLLAVPEAGFTVADSAPDARVPDSLDGGGRPELAAARERENAAIARLRGGRSGYQPRLNAFGSLDYDRGWVARGDGGSYSAGVVAQWDLWDGFSTRSRVREAQADLELAREEQVKLRLAIELEVEQARLNLTDAVERLSVSSKAVDQAAESAGIMRHRFQQGLVLAAQAIDSETALVVTRMRRAEAESDHRIAVAALRKALAWPQLDSHPTQE